MIIGALESSIHWLEQQLSEAVAGKRRSEQERDECGRAVDYFRKLRSDKQDELMSVYHRLMASSDEVKGTRFKRMYQARIKEILQGKDAAMAYEKLEQGASNAVNAHQQAEDAISAFMRKIRQIEEEMSQVRRQIAREQEENK